jgi:hypothetical protein
LQQSLEQGICWLGAFLYVCLCFLERQDIAVRSHFVDIGEELAILLAEIVLVPLCVAEHLVRAEDIASDTLPSNRDVEVLDTSYKAHWQGTTVLRSGPSSLSRMDCTSIMA